MKAFANRMATTGIALASVGALVVAPTVQAPPRPADPVVRLTAAVSPPVVHPLAQPPLAQQPLVQQPLVEQTNVLGALLSLDLGRFIIPPSLGQPFPSPDLPGPSPTPNEFEDAIINSYYVIEPWVRYGFELATYAAGWVPWVGWLSPQIMIFYNFGERIVESLVVNSANWLWGPLPFGEGLGNIARDSWDALVQLGIDEWNFWLPPLPPLPFDAQQAQSATTEGLDRSVAPPLTRPHPLRELLAALRDSLADTDAPTSRDGDLPVDESASVPAHGVVTPADSVDEVQVQADVPLTDVTSSGHDETNPSAGTSDLSGITSEVASPPQTLPRELKPFGRKPKPTADPSELPSRTSSESLGEPKSPDEPSDDGAVKPRAPKKRSDNPRKHRVADSPNGSAANSPGAA